MENNLADKAMNIDVTDYWMIIRKRLFQILLILLFVVILTVYYTLQQEPKYKSECKIRISARQPVATIEGAQITWYGSGSNEMNSEIELINNKDEILNAAVDILKNKTSSKYVNSDENKEYYNDYELTLIKNINLSAPEKDYVANLTGASLRGKISVEPLPQSDIIIIGVTDRYPELTSILANVLAIVYRADFWKSKTQDARETKLFVEEQLNVVKAELEKTRENLQQVSEASISLGDTDTYKKGLTELRIELEKIKETYQENHPRVMKQRKLIASIENQLAKLPKTKQAYDDNTAEWEIKQALRKNLGEIYLKANIDYEAKRQKAKDEIQIISLASNPSKLSPKETMNIIVGAIFGLILGIVYAFVWEGLDTSIGKIEDVERITGLPVIAHIPLIGGKITQNAFLKPFNALKRFLEPIIPFRKSLEPLDLDKKILFNYDPLSVTAEAYRTLRTNIQFAIGTSKKTGNVIAITSTSPREGKTLTSTNLSIALAQMGKMTILVEADMRRPRIADTFKIKGKYGLSDLLIGTVKKEEAILTTADFLMGNSEWDKLIGSQGIDNLHIILSGTIPPNPTELLLSTEFRDFVNELKASYDFVIFDCPPILPVSDASIVGTVVDGTVIIYQSDTTSRHLLLRAIQTLRKNQSRLLGIVINQLSFDVVMMKSSRYKYQYGYGYSTKEE